MQAQIVRPQQIGIHDGALAIGGIQALQTARIIRQLGEHRIDNKEKLPAGFKPKKFYYSPDDLAQTMTYIWTGGYIFDGVNNRLVEVGKRDENDPTSIEIGAPLLGEKDCFVIDQSSKTENGETTPLRSPEQLVDQWKNGEISGEMLAWQFKRKFQTFRNIAGFTRDGDRVTTLKLSDGSEYHLRPEEVIRTSRQKSSHRKLTEAIGQFDHVILDLPQTQLKYTLDPWLFASKALITYDFRSLPTGENPSIDCWRFMGMRPDIRIAFLLRNKISFDLSIASVESPEAYIEAFALHNLNQLPAGVLEYLNTLGRVLVNDFNERQRKTTQVSAVSAQTLALTQLYERKKKLYDFWFQSWNKSTEREIMKEIRETEKEILALELDMNLSPTVS